MNDLIIASGPVIVENGCVLLNKHGDTSFYKFCGGRREHNDSLQDTAKREFKEEMGTDCEILEPKPFLMYTTKETDLGMNDVILVHYLAKRIGEINPGPDIREWKFVPIGQLTDEELAPNIIPTLQHFGFMP